MPTLTLKDHTPTTTITFASFEEITDRIDDKNFVIAGMPENEPSLIVPLLSWIQMLKIKFQLKNDATFPTSGESAADKYANLKTLIRTGGDSKGLLTLTFDSEDSTEGTPQLESYNGSVKNLQKRSIAGEHVTKIDGSFEFYEGEVD